MGYSRFSKNFPSRLRFRSAFTRSAISSGAPEETAPRSPDENKCSTQFGFWQEIVAGGRIRAAARRNGESCRLPAPALPHGATRSARSGNPALRRSSRYLCFIGSRIGVQDSDSTDWTPDLRYSAATAVASSIRPSRT